MQPISCCTKSPPCPVPTLKFWKLMYSPQQFPSYTLARVRLPSSPSSSDGVPSSIEASLLNLYHHHHSNSLSLREQTEKAKRDAVRKAAVVSDLLVDAVNRGVQESFIYEKRIEMEIRALASTIARFMKQTDQWLTSTHAINTAIKEFGDFENWMKMMEFDCKSINATIRNIHPD